MYKRGFITNRNCCDNNNNNNSSKIGTIKKANILKISLDKWGVMLILTDATTAQTCHSLAQIGWDDQQSCPSGRFDKDLRSFFPPAGPTEPALFPLLCLCRIIYFFLICIIIELTSTHLYAIMMICTLHVIETCTVKLMQSKDL